MISAEFNNIKISGIAAAVPTKTVNAHEYDELFGEDTVSKNIATTGVRESHHASKEQTSSDLAYVAAKRLMKEMDSLNLSKDEGAGLSKMGTSFVKLSVAVLILAAALKQLDGVENVFESVTVLTLLLGELIGAAWAINKLNLKP